MRRPARLGSFRGNWLSSSKGWWKHAEVFEYHIRTQIVRKQGLLLQQARAKVLLVIVAEDGDYNRLVAEKILDGKRGKKIAAGRDADGEAESCSKLLRHQNRISIRDGYGRIQLREIDDRGDELVGYALNAMVSTLTAHA
jgi:hypothetical protein